jgi:hypothetical protein
MTSFLVSPADSQPSHFNSLFVSPGGVSIGLQPLLDRLAKEGAPISRGPLQWRSPIRQEQLEPAEAVVTGPSRRRPLAAVRYRCPTLTQNKEQDLLKALAALSTGMGMKKVRRDEALKDIEIPPGLQELTVFQEAKTLKWQEPVFTPQRWYVAPRGMSLEGMTDNSNTQFALLALWAAQRHGIPMQPVFEIMVERFERFQLAPSGIWEYEAGERKFEYSIPSMTCVGLLGLAIGHGLKLQTSGLLTPAWPKPVHSN